MLGIGSSRLPSFGIRNISSLLRTVESMTSQTARCISNSHQSTIFALSSGAGRSGVAVLRVSGSSARTSLSKMLDQGPLYRPKPRYAALQRIFDPVSREVIDRGLVIWFPRPHSFTGEDCVEFHMHGGHAVIAALIAALGKLPGYRHAEPGEFTKRAFLNGKLDLTEVEGLADLIHADTEAQRRQALRQMEGELGQLLAKWRQQIIQCLASVEAYIDFSEDENIEEDVLQIVKSKLGALQSSIQQHLDDGHCGERLREGVHVTIVGQPNVGKSTLLNALSKRPAAIVSPVPGTTRDIIDTSLNLAGYPIVLSDTAGLRTTCDAVELEGVERAQKRAKEADACIVMMDAVHLQPETLEKGTEQFVQWINEHTSQLNIGLDRISPSDNSIINQTTSRSVHMIEEMISTGPVVSEEQFINSSHLSNDQEQSYQKPSIIILNKSDLLPKDVYDKLSSILVHGLKLENLNICILSCATGQGMDIFLDCLQRIVKQLCGDPLSGSPSLTQARHRTNLQNCLQHIQAFHACSDEGDVVIAAEQLRKAAQQIGRITGKICAEDILNVIFQDFCIGK